MHYVFGDFSLDTARYELRRSGKVVPLRGKVFDVLAYLVTHHERVVSRDDLLEQVVVVEPHAPHLVEPH